VEKPDYKEKYGFEDNSDKVAEILWRRLREFVPFSERKQLRQKLLRISKIELMLQGNNSPQKQTVKARADHYFTIFIPQIYEMILGSFKNETKQYYPHKDCGPLESVEPGYLFYSLEGVAEQIENTIRQKYLK